MVIWMGYWDTHEVITSNLSLSETVSYSGSPIIFGHTISLGLAQFIPSRCTFLGESQHRFNGEKRDANQQKCGKWRYFAE